MRSTWKGQLGFGLVTMPVKLYKTREVREGTGLHLMHSCGSRPEQVYFCPQCQTMSKRGELGKGYEVGDRMLPVPAEALEKLPLSTARRLEIVGFISDGFDPRLPIEPYYLAPDKGGEKPFALLIKLMSDKGLKGVSKIAFRDREHLCVISPFNGVMLLHTICFRDEVRECNEIEPRPVSLSEKELQLGEQLISQMVIPWKHEDYQDDYHIAFDRLIEALANGTELPALPEAKQTGETDLIEKLMASVGV